MNTIFKNGGSAPVHYHDLSARLSLTAFTAIIISAYGRDGFLNTLSDKAYYRELIILLCCTASVAGWISFVTRLLDRFYDWYDQFLMRILCQVLIGVFLSGLITYLLAAYYFRFIGADIEKTTFMSFAFPPLMLMITLFNSYYYILYIFRKGQKLQEQQEILSRRLTKAPQEGKSPVYNNLQIAGQVISQPEIAWCYCKKKKSYVKVFTGNTGRIACTLEELYQQLDPKSFFRINRQVIVNRHACQEFQPLPYGRLMLTTQPALPIELAIVSQLRSAAFLEWIKRGPG